MILTVMAAAGLAASLAIMHCTQGKRFLVTRMLKSNIDEHAKQLLLCSFYCQTVFFVASTLALAVCAFAVISNMYGFSLLLFIGLIYGMCGVWLLYIAYFAPPKSTKRLMLVGLWFCSIALLSVVEPLLLFS